MWLWLMQALDNGAYAVSIDPCAMTQTFITPTVEGYTREMTIGFIPPSETEGAQKLYRFYSPDSEDCMLSTEDTEKEGYLKQGFLGYIYNDPVEGTAPLYQFYNKKRKDHLITLDPGAEGLNGYGAPEVLGYVLPALDIESQERACNVPLWRFCKRIHKSE